MGMSEDFALAIAEGATMVRIGSALFGEAHRPMGSRPPNPFLIPGQQCMTISESTIAFIGGGNMARSLIGGLLARGRDPAARSASPNRCRCRCAMRWRAISASPCSTDGADAVAGAPPGCWPPSRR
jgi:hypothetical protein